MELSELVVDLEELEADKRKNLEERRKFQEWYAGWLKNPNHPWPKDGKKAADQSTESAKK